MTLHVFSIGNHGAFTYLVRHQSTRVTLKDISVFGRSIFGDLFRTLFAPLFPAFSVFSFHGLLGALGVQSFLVYKRKTIAFDHFTAPRKCIARETLFLDLHSGTQQECLGLFCVKSILLCKFGNRIFDRRFGNRTSSICESVGHGNRKRHLLNILSFSLSNVIQFYQKNVVLVSTCVAIHHYHELIQTIPVHKESIDRIA